MSVAVGVSVGSGVGVSTGCDVSVGEGIGRGVSVAAGMDGVSVAVGVSIGHGVSVTKDMGRGVSVTAGAGSVPGPAQAMTETRIRTHRKMIFLIVMRSPFHTNEFPASPQVRHTFSSPSTGATSQGAPHDGLPD